MTEVYRDSINRTVELVVPGATVTTVKIIRDDLDTLISPAASVVTVPYSTTNMDGEFDVEWTYTVDGNVYIRKERHAVVTPYFTQTELVNHDPDMSILTAEKVVKLERLVRGVIDAFCGHNFGLERGIIVAYGTGGSVLHLSKRVEAIVSIGLYDTPLSKFGVAFRAVNQGYGIELSGYSADASIKVPAYEEQTYAYTLPMGSVFRENASYLVEGVFGYHSIPSDVKLAALLLAEMFSCDEELWRDRYIQSISGEGFSFTFKSDAFVGTGSVTADQLLGKYVANKLAII